MNTQRIFCPVCSETIEVSGIVKANYPFTVESKCGTKFLTYVGKPQDGWMTGVKEGYLFYQFYPNQVVVSISGKDVSLKE